MFENYSTENGFFDEVFKDHIELNTHYTKVVSRFDKLRLDEFAKLNQFAKVSFFNQGITFNVYSNNEGVERVFPFDIFPRIIPKEEWASIERGVAQRNEAINAFLYDVYHEQHILKDGVIPLDLIYHSKAYCKEMIGFDPPGGIYVHISGTDIIRHSDGKYHVLEDNVRSPSGVSYVLSNREAMKKIFPSLFLKLHVQTVSEYPEYLSRMMHSVAPPSRTGEINCVLLTPGVYNSAYFEHAFLAMKLGIPLVEGRDLFVDGHHVYMKNIEGRKQVHVIYRRIDDTYLDPLVFDEHSLIGVPGLMSAYRSGNVTIINAPGTGIADDKAVYVYLPEMIRYYLKEEPILQNIKTYRCEVDEDYKYVMQNMHNLVIKPVDESGGYGVMIGNTATEKEMDEYKEKIKLNRGKYIAQPIMSLSVHPTFIEQERCFEPRHIDLRTFSLLGMNMNYVCKGGLTRVALKKGNLVVNSSQGGGSKDTWVID